MDKPLDKPHRGVYELSGKCTSNVIQVYIQCHKEVHFHSSAAKCSYIANIALTTGERTFKRVVFLNSLAISWFLIVLYVLCRTYKYLKGENWRFKCRWQVTPRSFTIFQSLYAEYRIDIKVKEVYKIDSSKYSFGSSTAEDSRKTWTLMPTTASRKC